MPENFPVAILLDAKRYMPILKAKQGDMNAIRNSRRRDGLEPLFEAIPGRPAGEVPNRLEGHWGPTRRYFVDFAYCDADDEELGPHEHSVAQCFSEVARLGQHAVPVTGTGRSQPYQHAVRAISAEQGRGVALRLEFEDFADAAPPDEAIARLLEFLQLPKSQIDLILDLGGTNGSGLGSLVLQTRAMMTFLPDLGDWRTFTLASGAFPNSLRMYPVDQWSQVPQTEWGLWQHFRASPVGRVPSYGDYSVSHVDLPPSGFARTTVQMRYTVDGHLLLYRGRTLGAPPDDGSQFNQMCSQLVDMPEFAGETFSFGDEQIHQKATTPGSPGNASTWRCLWTSHHVETVMERLASLP